MNFVLMTGPLGNSEFCFPRMSLFPSGPVIKCLLFLAGQVIKCFVIPSNSKLEKTAKKSFALRWLADKFAVVWGSTT